MSVHRHIVGILLSAAVVVSLGWPASAVAQAEGQELRGLVVDGGREGRAVAGATVRLIEEGEEARTDEEGRFHFDSVEPGMYRLRLEASGYRDAEVRAAHPASETEELRVVLAPILFRLDAVVASASPLASPVGYQPAAALDRDRIFRRMAPSLGSLLDGQPGVAQRSFGPVPGRPVIRGFDGDRVLLLENGERMGDLSATAADHAVALGPSSARRVEVVRGPASLLYGSSALGGVVNMITDDVPSRWGTGTEGHLEAHAASIDRSGTFSGRLAHGGEVWAGTGRVSAGHSGDVRTPAALLPGTHSRSIDVSGGLGRRGPSSEGGIAVSLLKRGYGVPEAIDDPDTNVEIRMQREGIQGHFSRTGRGWLEGLELRVNATRLHQREVEGVLLDDGTLDEDLELEYRQHEVSSTLTLRHSVPGTGASGAFGLSATGRELEVGGLEAFTPGSREGSLAVFTFHELPLHPILRLQFGARGEGHRMRTVPNADFPELRDRRGSTTLSGSMGLNLRPTDRIEAGLQVARAHRHPRLEELFAHGPHLAAGVFEVGNPDLVDEIGRGLDAFVRWRTEHFAVELAGFVNRIENFVVFESTGVDDTESGLPVFEYEAAPAEMRGGELTLEAFLTPRLRLEAASDYVRGTRVGDDPSPLPYIPPLRARIGLEHQGSSLELGGLLRAVGSQDRVAARESPTDGYRVIELHTRIRLDPNGQHSLSLRVENATDTLYRDHLSRVRERHLSMPGRSVSVGYRWVF